MVDRRVRYSNPNGKFPAPGGGPQLLEEFKAPALIDFQSERLPAMRPVAAENTPVVAAVKSVPVADVKRSRSNEQAAPESSPEPATWNPEQRETPRLEQAEPQNRPYFSESDGRKGIAGHPGTVLTFEKVETLQRVRADSREKTVNALRQLLENVSSGNIPWELLQADYDAEADPGKRPRSSKQLGGSKGIAFNHTDQLGQVAEIVVPLAEGLVRGRALVACPGWVLLMLLFLAATCLAMVAEQGFLNAGLFMHFLDSKAWTFIKLGLIFAAALAALRGLFFSSFSKPFRNSKAR